MRIELARAANFIAEKSRTDGWFILMHPQLVAGAWVGFNDNRVTMGSSWGQGAHSALPIIGDFSQQSITAGVVDARAKFSAPRSPGGDSSDTGTRVE